VCLVVAIFNAMVTFVHNLVRCEASPQHLLSKQYSQHSTKCIKVINYSNTFSMELFLVVELKPWASCKYISWFEINE